jgi:hypothetical protein
VSFLMYEEKFVFFFYQCVFYKYDDFTLCMEIYTYISSQAF